MKRLICLLLIAVLLLAGCSKKDETATPAAEETPVEEEIEVFDPAKYNVTGQWGENLQWGMNHETGELGIGGEGAMQELMDEETMPWSEFAMTTVKIYHGVTSVSAGAFENHATVVNVEMANTVTTIGERAFYACKQLDKVQIPASVQTIGTSAFSNCEVLTQIDVSSDNAAYITVGGVLLTKDGKTLVQYPAGKEQTLYEIPEGVETIEPFAFAFCGETPNTIQIPASVTTIGNGAFLGCRVLNTVIYSGTESQWKNIKIGAENDLLKLAERQYK